MASDNLNQLGKNLNKTRKSIKQTTRRISKNLSEVEEVEDIVGPINTFRFEFKTYKEGAYVFLNIVFKKQFKEITRKGYG